MTELPTGGHKKGQLKRLSLRIRGGGVPRSLEMTTDTALYKKVEEKCY